VTHYIPLIDPFNKDLWSINFVPVLDLGVYDNHQEINVSKSPRNQLSGLQNDCNCCVLAPEHLWLF
jgi:hypothetical protein